MSKALEGKTAVITGASSGLGRAIAEHYLAAGARIVVFDRDQEGLEALFGFWGGGHRAEEPIVIALC